MNELMNEKGSSVRGQWNTLKYCKNSNIDGVLLKQNYNLPYLFIDCDYL